MSRIGKLPVAVPQCVKVTIEEDTKLTVESYEGKKGKLSHAFPPEVKLIYEEGKIKVSIAQENRNSRAMFGLTRSLVANMVNGVVSGFEKRLEVNGIGYKASVVGKMLLLSLGYSTDIAYAIPEGINITCEKQEIIISGVDKQKVGQIAADIRNKKPPEPYKGKGIKYKSEVLRRKKGNKK